MRHTDDDVTMLYKTSNNDRQPFYNIVATPPMSLCAALTENGKTLADICKILRNT